MDYLTAHLWQLWATLIFVCLILELFSGDFFITCFAIGGLFGLCSSLLDFPFWAQIIIWIVFSLLSIWLIRPRLAALLHKGGEERQSNADALIGREGTVIETIEPGQHGYVKVDGDEWKAVSTAADTLAVGEPVRIVGRESIIVTVERAS